MAATLKTLKVVNYKGHKISLVVDDFQQEFVMIDTDNTLYCSIADAKRVINGKKPIYETI